MSGYTRHFSRPFTASRNKAHGLTKFIAMLTLALFIGGVGFAAPAQAAEDLAPSGDDTIDSFSMSISGIQNPACANSLYEVQVFVRVDRVAQRNGVKVDLEGGLGPANISVKGSSSNPSVASFHPETAKTTALDNQIGRGADFVLQTEEPGSTTLTLTTAMTSEGESLTFPAEEQQIKVVNCKFRVTMNTIMAGFIPAINETVVSTVTGEISPNAEGALTGDAEVTWKFQQATPCLQAIINISPSPSHATLTGSLSEDAGTLTVRVDYDQVMFFQQNTVLCGSGASASHQAQFQAPPVTFSAPATGRVFSQPVSMPLGEMMVNGTSIITVTPLEEK